MSTENNENLDENLDNQDSKDKPIVDLGSEGVEQWYFNGKTYDVNKKNKDKFIKDFPLAKQVNQVEVYEVDGKRYDVSLKGKEKFLKDFPNAELLGKQISPIKDSEEGPKKKEHNPYLANVAGEFPSENILLDSLSKDDENLNTEEREFQAVTEDITRRDENKAIERLESHYSSWGFSFEGTGNLLSDEITITAANGDKKEFKIDALTIQQDMKTAAEITKWMEERKVDKGDELNEVIKNVKISSEEEKKISTEDYNNAVNEIDNEYDQKLQQYEKDLATFNANKSSGGEMYSFREGTGSLAAHEQGVLAPTKPELSEEAQRIGTLRKTWVHGEVMKRYLEENPDIDPNQIDDKLEYQIKTSDRYKELLSVVQNEVKEGSNLEMMEKREKWLVEQFTYASKVELLEDKVIDKINDTTLFSKTYKQKHFEKEAKDRTVKLKKETQDTILKLEVLDKDLDTITGKIEELKPWFDNRGNDIVNEIKNLQEQGKKETDPIKLNEIQKKLIKLQREYTDKAHELEAYQKKGLEYYGVRKNIFEELGELEIKADELGVFTKAVARNPGVITNFFSGMILEAGLDIGQNIINYADTLFQMPEEILKNIESPWMKGLMRGAMNMASPVVGLIKPVFGDNYVNEITGKKESLWDRADKNLDRWQQTQIIDKSRKDISYDDIDSAADWAEWGANLFSSQIPNLVMLAYTGPAGLALMGASSGGAKMRQLEDEKALYESSGGLYGKDYDFWTMAANATVTGAAEALSEKVTLSALKKTKNIWKGGKSTIRGIEKSLRKNIWTFDNARNAGVEMLEEGFSESLSAIAGNIADIYSGKEGISIWDGVEESFVSGAFISGGIQGVRLLPQLTKPFTSKDTNQKLGEISSKVKRVLDSINELEGNHSYGSAAKARKMKKLQEEYESLVKESNRVLQEDIKRVDLLHPSEKKALLNIEKLNYESRKEVEAINANDKLTEKEKADRIKEIQSSIDTRLKRKQQIIDRYPPNVVNKNYERQNLWMNSMQEMINKMGGVKMRTREVREDEFADIVSRSQAKDRDDVGMSLEQVNEVSEQNKGLIEGLKSIINDKSSTKQEIADAQEMLKEAEGQVLMADSILNSNLDYGIMIPKFNDKGNIESLDIVVNKDAAIKDGMFSTAAHEFIHAAFFNTLKADPLARKILGEQVQDILQDPSVEFAPGALDMFNKRISTYSNYDSKGNLTNSAWEEVMAIASEMMANGDIKFNDSLLQKLKNVFRRFSQNYLKGDIEFNTTEDVKNFMRDYHHSVSKNKPNKAIAKMLVKGANGKMFKDARSKKQRQSEASFSRAVDLNLKSNPDLIQEFDQFVKNSDGSPKYRNHEEFKHSPDYQDAMMHLLEGRALDGLIRQGVTDAGVPVEKLREFEQKVKARLAERFIGGLTDKAKAKIKKIEEQRVNGELTALETAEAIEKIENDPKNQLAKFDLDKNDSLAGWVFGKYRSVHWAKEDVKKRYIKDKPGFEGPSLDKQIGTEEGSMTLRDVLGGQQDAAMAAIDEMDLSFGRKQELKQLVSELKVQDVLELDIDSKEAIRDVIANADLGLDVANYKAVRKLLNDVTMFTKLDPKTGKPQVHKTGKNKGEVKLFRPTSEKKTEPIGPLFEVLNAVSAEFGIDPLRILSTQDLDGTQRSSAQNLIFDLSTNEDGSFNKQLFELLPEGQDRSGRATGIANTKLGDFYIKGDRVKSAEGADSKLGNKYAQEKRTDVTRDEFLDKFGINPDGSKKPGTDADGAIRELVQQLAVLQANQSIREHNYTKGDVTDAVVAKIGDGKSEASFSKNPNTNITISNKWDQVIDRVAERHGQAPLTKETWTNIINEVYEGELSKNMIKKMANKLESQFQNWYDKAEFFGDTYNLTLKESLVNDWFMDADQRNDLNIKRSLDLKENPGNVFKDKKGLEKARENIVTNIEEDFKAKMKPSDIALDMLGYASKGFVGSGKLGGNEHVPSKPGSVKVKINKNAKAENRPDNRYKPIKDVEDNFALFNNAAVPKDPKTNKWIRDTKKKGIVEVWENGKWKEVKITLLAENTEAVLKDRDGKTREQQSKRAREVSKRILDRAWKRVKDPRDSYSKKDFGALLMNLGSSMDSPLRKSAPATAIQGNIKDVIARGEKKGIKPGQSTQYEHSVSKAVINNRIIESYENHGELKIDEVFKNYEVFVISKSWDKSQDRAGYKTKLPIDGIRATNIDTIFQFAKGVVDGEFDIRDLASLESIKPTKDTNLESDSKKTEKLVKKIIDLKIKPNNAGTVNKIKINQDNMLSKNPDIRGMSTFDFDETLIIDGKNFVIATNPNTGKEIKISSGNWPIQGPALAEQGYTFNFDDFVNVRGGVEGPLFQKLVNRIKKFGPKNNFVLTARPQEAAVAIHGWLKSKGVNIPLENITGLANSTGAAKAQWMMDKFAEGYNDMYFVDDALPNVEAVKEVIDQLDIKGSSVQAKLEEVGKIVKTDGDAMMSKVEDSGKDPIDVEFNEMLERKSGIGADIVISPQQARIDGRKRFGRWIVPASAEDFKGLVYSFLGKGKQGNADLKFFKKHLFDPFAEGIRNWNTLKQRMVEEFAELRKKFPNVASSLKDTVSGTPYSVDHAIRVYLWNKNGIDIPGISMEHKRKLIQHVKNSQEIMAFAEGLGVISRASDGYVTPTDYWGVENIGADLNRMVNETHRTDMLSDWIRNKDTIMSPENLNKIEAIYGKRFVDALKNMLQRMETGRNRMTSTDADVNMWYDWINGSVGATMFWNMRSALLQTISMVNFINWSDNNPFKAAVAFANLPQFCKDFAMIFNSDMLKQRRSGLQIDVSASELTQAFKQSRGKPQAVIAWLLEKGFTPTRIADSFAIAFGGASMYRNRVNKYIKEGMTQQQAQDQAWLDFQEIAEETQQSSRPDLISQQQAGPLGRLVLAWQNTPMQMTRLMWKAVQDLSNGRGDVKTNISKIIYYGTMQNLLFGALQSGLMFALFGGEDEEELDKRKARQTHRVINGALDTLLRGTGIYGAAIATLKNVLIKGKEQLDKPYGKKDYSQIAIEAVSLSPPMGSKLRKLIGSYKTYDWNRGVGKELGFRLENPTFHIASNFIESLTNIPVARTLNKMNNLEEAITGNHDLWQRVALVSGWNRWDIGIKDEELEEAKDAAKIKQKEIRKQERIEQKEIEKQEKLDAGLKKIRCSGIRSNGERCSIMSPYTKEKTWKCQHHMDFTDGMDRDGDGLKEYRCTATTSSGKRCKNKTENKNKKCYAHQ